MQYSVSLVYCLCTFVRSNARALNRKDGITSTVNYLTRIQKEPINITKEFCIFHQSLSYIRPRPFYFLSLKFEIHKHTKNITDSTSLSVARDFKQRNSRWRSIIRPCL